MPTGFRPHAVAFRIARKLAEYADDRGRGEPFTDGCGFVAPFVLPSGRLSFSPDAAYYTGPLPPNPMKFVPGVPDFAVEVRSDDDREPDMADKRADYFAAGTLVVWDVDPEAGAIDCYRSTAPDRPSTFGPGHEADAEPAVPGWRIDVDWVMR